MTNFSDKEMTANDAMLIAQSVSGFSTEDLREAYHLLRGDHIIEAERLIAELCRRAIDRELHKLSYEPR